MSKDHEQVLAFVEVTQADPDLAAVFLKNNDWQLEPAVQEYMNNPGLYMVESQAAEADTTVRAPLAPTMTRLADDEYEPHTRPIRGKRKRIDAPPQRQLVPSDIFSALRDLQSEELFFRHFKAVASTL